MTEQTEVLSAAELEGMLAQINTATPSGARNYALLQLMSQTGCRCGEALNVTNADIRREQWLGVPGWIWVLRLPKRATKGCRDRQGIPLTAATRQAIEVWQGRRAELGIGDGPLFCTISHGARPAGFATGDGELVPGRALNSRYVRELVARLAERAGIGKRVHPHMLRHTALTALYDRSRDLRMVQTVAGHADSRMTERYTHVHPVDVALAMGVVGEDEDEGEAVGEP